jgi:hypothetical protein
MERIPRILLAAILFTGSAVHALTCPEPGTNDLAGLWESQQTTKGGIGHTVEFRPDGTFVEATTVMVDSVYRIAGDHLLIGEAPEEVQDSTFRIEGDTLVQAGPNGSTLRKERVGKAGAGSPAIVGVWRFRDVTGAIAFERYTEDGRVLLRLPLAGSTGCYKLAGDRLAMSKPDRKDVAVPFDLKAGELVLKGPGKNPVTYGQVAAGPWYDREHIVPL